MHAYMREYGLQDCWSIFINYNVIEKKTVGKESGKVKDFHVNTLINVKLTKPDVLILFLMCCFSLRSQIQNWEYNLYA